MWNSFSRSRCGMTNPSSTSWQLFPLGTLGMMQRCGRCTPTWGDQNFCQCLTIWKASFAITPASFLASSWQVTSGHWSIQFQFVIRYFHHLTTPALASIGAKGCTCAEDVDGCWGPNPSTFLVGSVWGTQVNFWGYTERVWNYSF